MKSEREAAQSCPTLKSFIKAPFLLQGGPLGIFPVERMMVSAARQGEETPAGPVPQLEPVPGAPWEEAGGERP